MPKSLPSLPRKLLNRFARAERGATAIEFALVSVPLLMMVFGVIELALVFMVGTSLDFAAETASRQIRTGEFQSSGASTKSDFKALVCANMSWLAGQCANSLFLDVRTYGDFNTLATTPRPNASAFDPAKTCFMVGQPTDIVLVRTYFQWDLFTPLLNAALENMGGGSGKRLIGTTTAFRNEPYNANPPLGASGCAAL